MDPLNDKDLIIAKFKKRSRIMSVITGAMVFVTLISFIYAFVQKGMYEAVDNAIRGNKNASVADSLKNKLNQCVEAARTQQKMSELAEERAREAMQKALKK